MCRRFSVENIGVENFPLKMEKWPVENFLSKIVMFAVFAYKSKIFTQHDTGNKATHMIKNCCKYNVVQDYE